MGHHYRDWCRTDWRRNLLPVTKENEELAAADKVMTGQRSGKKILNVNAKIIKPQLLKDEIQISGSLLPDEEVTFLSRHPAKS